MGLQWLFFDAAFTLIEPYPSVGSVYAREAADEGVRADPAALDAAFLPTYRHFSATQSNLETRATEKDVRAFWRDVVEEVFRTAGSQMPTGSYFDRVFDLFATSACWRIYPDVSETVSRARTAGLSLGVLSNFDYRLRPLLEQLGLASQFDLLVISAEIGATKPDVRAFRKARTLAGDPPAEACALIGDSPREDFRGAREAGWHACLVDRVGVAADDGARRRKTLPDCLDALLE